MGRKPCCAKEGVNRGAWTPKEDRILTTYINIHGEGKWRSLPQNAGLNRCGKSCRLRWLNYLKPDIKRGNISVEEEDLIIRLHSLLGNRWSLIAKSLPGRTDNEIKNYWNTTLSKTRREISNKEQKKPEEKENVAKPHRVIRTKAIKCTKVVQLDNQMSAKGDSLLTCDRESPSSLSTPEDNSSLLTCDRNSPSSLSTPEDNSSLLTCDRNSPSSLSTPEDNSSDLFMDLDINDILLSDFSDLEFNEEKGGIRENDCGINGDFNGINMSFDSEFSVESLLNSTCSDESILMEDLEAMAATLDQLIDDSEPRFNGVESFLNLEDEWLSDKDVLQTL